MTILERILADRKQGIRKNWISYTKYFSDYDTAKTVTLENRVHKLVSRNRHEIEKADANYELANVNTPAVEARIINDKKKTESTTIEEYLDYAEAGQLINNRIDDYRYEELFEFNKAICVLASSDEHLGSNGCTHREAIDDFNFMIDNDVKIILNGDLGEQKREFPKNIFSVLSQVLSPSQQEDFITKLLIKMKDNILCSVEGNHGSNSRSGNEHSMRKCCREAGISHHAMAALIKINIQGAEYRIYSRHRPMASSKISPLIGIRKMASVEKADVFIGSHLHQPTYGVDWVLGEMRVCILTGTFNTNALYSKAYGENSARAEFPCLLLFPKTKKIMVFTSMRDAVAYRDLIIDSDKD